MKRKVEIDKIKEIKKNRFVFFDKDGQEYFLLYAPVFKTHTILELDIKKSFYLTEKPDYITGTAKEWQVYRQAHEFAPNEYKALIEESTYADDEEENKAFIKKERIFIDIFYELLNILPFDKTKQFLKDYSVDFLKEKLKENKYWFCDRVCGNFPRIAKKQVPYTFDLRLEETKHCIAFLLTRNEQSGNTWMYLDALLCQMNKLVSIPYTKEYILAYMRYDKEFVYEEEKIAFAKTYKMEQEIYDFVRILAHTRTKIRRRAITSPIACKEQIRATNGLLNGSHISILTGGPGTGKTTTINDLIKNMLPEGANIHLAAFAGKAVRRMEESLDTDLKDKVKISTVHKFLGYGMNPKAKKEQREAIALCDFLIVDESSMIDIFLFHELLSFLDLSRVKLILVGDEHQLPSIKAGNILSDLIHLGVETYYLKENHRSVKSIMDNAHCILEEKDDFVFDEHFVLVDTKRYEEILQSIDFSLDENILLLPYRKEYDKNDKFMDGNTTTANRLIQETIFGESYMDKTVYHPEDKVIIVKTNYKKGYFNGEIGVVTSTNADGVYMDFGDRVLLVEDFKEIELAYALTIHKTQGSEYDNVYIYLPKEGGSFISNELLYTAITRAKVKCTIIGDLNTLKQCAKNHIGIRQTFLSAFTPIAA